MRLTIRLAAAGLATLLFADGVAAQDMDLMQFADANHDGKVTPEEFTAFCEQGWNYFTQGADKVKVADLEPMARGALSVVPPDANGILTKQAYMAATPARFKAADKNGDGVLDRDELNNSVKPAG